MVCMMQQELRGEVLWASLMKDLLVALLPCSRGAMMDSTLGTPHFSVMLVPFVVLALVLTEFALPEFS